MCRDGHLELTAAVAEWGAEIVGERAPTLDELFFAHVGIRAATESDS